MSAAAELQLAASLQDKISGVERKNKNEIMFSHAVDKSEQRGDSISDSIHSLFPLADFPHSLPHADVSSNLQTIDSSVAATNYTDCLRSIPSAVSTNPFLCVGYLTDTQRVQQRDTEASMQTGKDTNEQDDSWVEGAKGSCQPTRRFLRDSLSSKTLATMQTPLPRGKLMINKQLIVKIFQVDCLRPL